MIHQPHTCDQDMEFFPGEIARLAVAPTPPAWENAG
jgi:hypothetical protein